MPTVFHERARVGALSRSRSDDDPELVTARQNLKALNLEEYVRKVVSEAPPLTPEQRDRIAAILRGTGPPIPTSAPDPVERQQAATPSPEVNYSGCPALRENSKLRGDSA
ncbi:hypothetical protein NJB1507_29330 [Mycobacterium marinum]|uniref:hypothetical protein n=1 Tax=Mycobacterium marinum TaxID=1781 RepID=UPI0021C47EEF|nr:hypothetical protein [Mycobacterium marinum]GJO25672.1 hypothetical protein NJB1507_29330 [Mycobacterium marinum]